MKPSRRVVLASAAGVSLGFSAQLENGLSVNAPSGLRMTRHGDPRRPSVAVFIPSVETPAAVIEMPEHAWRKEKSATDQAMWFYKMYGPGSDPTTHAQVEWEVSANTLAYEMKAASDFGLSCRAHLEDDGVAIEYRITSHAVAVLAAAAAVTCVKLYRPFTDIFLERTYVPVQDSLELIASDSADRVAKNAEEWLPCRYIARVAKDGPPRSYQSERLNGVTRHFKAKAADMPFLATESEPRGWTAGTHTLSADSVFTNPARTCHHTDPVAFGIRDGRAQLRLKVFFVRGDATACYRKVVKHASAGGA